jgi:hypothetical protein
MRLLLAQCENGHRILRLRMHRRFEFIVEINKQIMRSCEKSEKSSTPNVSIPIQNAFITQDPNDKQQLLGPKTKWDYEKQLYWPHPYDGGMVSCLRDEGNNYAPNSVQLHWEPDHNKMHLTTQFELNSLDSDIGKQLQNVIKRGSTEGTWKGPMCRKKNPFDFTSENLYYAICGRLINEDGKFANVCLAQGKYGGWPTTKHVWAMISPHCDIECTGDSNNFKLSNCKLQEDPIDPKPSTAD